MSSSPGKVFWIGDEDVATPFNAFGVQCRDLPHNPYFRFPPMGPMSAAVRPGLCSTLLNVEDVAAY